MTKGRREAGTTLVEVLMVIGILGIIGAVITEVVVVALKTTDTSARRISATNDASFLSTYFLGDAQSAKTVHVAPRTVLKAATAAETGGFTPADDAKTIDDGQIAAVNLQTGTLASITLSGFSPLPPAGSVIEEATLRIDHQETGDPTELEVIGAAGGESVTPPLESRAAPGEDRVTLDLATLGLRDPDDISSLSVTFQAQLAASSTAASARLDGIELTVRYSFATAETPLTGTAALPAEVFVNATPAVLELGAFATGAALLPPDSRIRSVHLSVNREHTGTNNYVKITVTPGTGPDVVVEARPGGVNCVFAQPCRDLGDLASIDLKALGLDAAGELNGSTITYEVSGSGRETLTSVVLGVASFPACGAALPDVTLKWVDPDPSPAQEVVNAASYTIGTPANGERILTRSYCKGGSIVGEQPVARMLAPTDFPLVTCNTPPEVDCPEAPETVTASLREIDGSRYSVTATRREATP